MPSGSSAQCLHDRYCNCIWTIKVKWNYHRWSTACQSFRFQFWWRVPDDSVIHCNAPRRHFTLTDEPRAARTGLMGLYMVNLPSFRRLRKAACVTSLGAQAQQRMRWGLRWQVRPNLSYPAQSELQVVNFRTFPPILELGSYVRWGKQNTTLFNWPISPLARQRRKGVKLIRTFFITHFFKPKPEPEPKPISDKKSEWIT